MLPAADHANGSISPRASPRIALVDNTCNTAYITAKLLRRAGYAADFIEQPNMPFNHQPVWEDADFVGPADEVAVRPAGDRYWRRIERRLGWRPPSWVIRPRWTWPADLSVLAELPWRLAAAMPLLLVPFGATAFVPMVPVIRTLRGYDMSLVIGPSAAIGYLARRPYAVVTMGWEIFTLPFLTTSSHIVRRSRAWLQRAALSSTTRILGLPSTDLEHLQRLRLEHLLYPFPIPVDVDGYARIEAGSRASVLGDELAARMAGKLVYFHPSRLSFAEKGTDRLLLAFREVLRSGVRGFLLMLQWGVDVERVRALAVDLGVADDVCILPAVLSKRRLIRTFSVTDVAMVQFVPRGYSTLDREALASGKPVSSSYDPAAPQPHPADDPAPILPARTVAEIRDAMITLSDPEVRARVGARGKEWARRNHQEAALKAIADLVDQITK